MGDYYDRQGKPIPDLLTWARMFEDRSYAQVADTTIGPARVSTVWRGLDHGHGWSPRPVIFETMVFWMDREAEHTFEFEGETHTARYNPEWDIRDRYSTEEEALAGHEAICDRVRGLLALDEELKAAEENGS